jgi:tetratricopeptide (TPR) repeat protein
MGRRKVSLREATLLEIAELLKANNSNAPKVCLLIGAGVSQTAGIGLSSDFVERIKSDYPVAYQRACNRVKFGDQPSYADCMDALPPAQQAELIQGEVEKAKINWAHIGIARMEQAGVLGAILTTNFDPLASRACALFNRFPAVYDLASLRDRDGKQPVFDASLIRGSAIFHLHGQHTGFLVLNTTDKLARQAERIKPVLSAFLKGHPIIIAGYSGENDPLVNEIASMAPFNHGLFWVCRDYKYPAPNVVNNLLALENCYIVRKYPSDRFFMHLANTMNLPLPSFLTAPFDHYRTILNQLKPYDDVGDLYGDDTLKSALDDIEAAEKCITQRYPYRKEIRELVSTGQYQQAIEKFDNRVSTLDIISKRRIAWAAASLGYEMGQKARVASGDIADELFAHAYQNYRLATKIHPDMHEAYNNWAATLAYDARRKIGLPAHALFREADEKFAIAFEKQPKALKILTNWGAMLSVWASGASDQEADRLYEEAYSKFTRSISSPDCHFETLTNWALALDLQARTKHGLEALALSNAACTKWMEAHEIKPGGVDILEAWGLSLMHMAKNSTELDSIELLGQAETKLLEAEALTPGIASYNLSCLYACRGDASKAIEWLRKAKITGVKFPDCEVILHDKDFDQVRQEPKFLDALREIGC